jgi:hypothetical protein
MQQLQVKLIFPTTSMERAELFRIELCHAFDVLFIDFFFFLFCHSSKKFLCFIFTTPDTSSNLAPRNKQNFTSLIAASNFSSRRFAAAYAHRAHCFPLLQFMTEARFLLLPMKLEASIAVEHLSWWLE